MAQDTTPAIVVYQGDGSNNVFSVPFDKGYYGDVKVLFVRRGLANYTYNPNTYTVSGRLYAWGYGLNYSERFLYTHTPNPAVGAPTYNASDVQLADNVSAISGQLITVGNKRCARKVQHDIANSLLLTWTGTTLQVGDYICIIRDTERGQPYSMPNNQKHIEAALDNLERQIQEVKDATDNALIVDQSYTIDSHKMSPLDWMKSIVRTTDFSARGLRYANGWLDYSTDDPNIAEGSKTWTHLLNTTNIKSIREVITIDPDTLQQLRSVYYTDQNGVEHAIALPIETLQNEIQQAIDTANQANNTANSAASAANTAISTANAAMGAANFAIKPTDMDNVTIQRGTGYKYEAQGVKNRNNASGAANIVYDWVGTEAQYYEQDIGGNHPDWICLITDDEKNVATLYITVDYNSPNSRLVITSGGSGAGTKITQANYSSTYLRLILS